MPPPRVRLPAFAESGEVDLSSNPIYITRVSRLLSFPPVLSLSLLFGAAALAQNPIPAPIPAATPGLARPVPGLPAPLPRTVQQPTVQPPMPPLPGNAAIAPAAAPGVEMEAKMEFENADIRTIMNIYQRLTKKELIYENSALQQGAAVTIIVDHEIPKDEAIRIIERTLLMNGVYLVPNEKGNTVSVFGLGKVPQSTGVPIFSDELEIPENDEVVSFLVRLKYADPQDVVQAVTPLVSLGNQQFTQVVPLPKAQALLVTDATPRLRGLLRVIREIDVPPAEVVSEFIQMERADAKDVLDKLKEIFEKTQQGQPGSVPGAVPPGGARQVAPAPVAVTPEGTPIPAATAVATSPTSVEISSNSLSEDSIIIGKIRLSADTRTNRIYVVTRPVNMPFIRKLVLEFDRDVKFGEPTVRPLRFVSAGDVLQPIVDAITEPGQKSEGGGGGSGGGRSQSNNRSNTNPNSGSSNLNNSGSFGSGGGGSNGGGMQLTESLDTGDRDTLPETKVIGNTKIIADKRANTIIVLGNAEVKAKIFKLLDHLDVRSPQVMLHTIIGELNLNNTEQFGVNYILHSGGKGVLSNALANSVTNNNNGTTGTGTTGTGTTGTGTTGTGTTTTSSSIVGSGFGFPGGSSALNLNSLLGNPNVTKALAAGATGFSGFITAGNAFTAIVDALESNTRFHVINRSTIFTSNNKKAILFSGSQLPIPETINAGFSGTTNEVNNGLVTNSSIQYKDVGIQLEVLPLINSDRDVYLDIVQKVDEQNGTSVISGNTLPIISSQNIKTSVTVANQGTLVLGGLIKETKNKTVTGVPYLMRIPVLGNLFKNTSTTKDRTELVVIIRPEVSWDAREDARTRERESEYMRIEPDLEATVYPVNIRQRDHVEKAEPVLRSAPVKLKQDVSGK